jgi:hypothetical protein
MKSPRGASQIVLPSADTAAMLFWALPASGQINMRKINAGKPLATKTIGRLTSPLDQRASHGWRSRREHCHHFSGWHQIANGQTHP